MTKEKKDHPILGGALGATAGAVLGVGAYSQYQRPDALAHKLDINLKNFQANSQDKLWRTARTAEQKRLVNALRTTSKAIKEHPLLVLGGSALLGGAFGAGMGMHEKTAEVKSFTKTANIHKFAEVRSFTKLADTGQTMAGIGQLFRGIANWATKRAPVLGTSVGEAVQAGAQNLAGKTTGLLSKTAPTPVSAFTKSDYLKRKASAGLGGNLTGAFAQ